MKGSRFRAIFREAGWGSSAAGLRKVSAFYGSSAKAYFTLLSRKPAFLIFRINFQQERRRHAAVVAVLCPAGARNFSRFRLDFYRFSKGFHGSLELSLAVEASCDFLQPVVHGARKWKHQSFVCVRVGRARQISSSSGLFIHSSRSLVHSARPEKCLRSTYTS
jgi:hypothetical protein